MNRSQLLVHDDRAMEMARATHGIPTNVTIERPKTNDVPHVVANNPDCIPVHTWLIYQAGLWFSISPLLKEVMAHYRLTFMQVFVNFVRTMLTMDTLMQILDKPFSAEDLLHVYTVVQPKKEPSNFSYEGNHYLSLRKTWPASNQIGHGKPEQGLIS